MSLSPELQAIRAHDMQPGLSSVNMGLVNRYMKKIKLIGSAVQVASLIRGQNIVKYEGLEVASGDLGIDENLLEKSLRELEEIGFVRVIRRSERIVHIEESIPILGNLYAAVGERIQQVRLNEVETASIRILDDLSLMPMTTVDLVNTHGIDEKALRIIRDIGKNTGFLDEYVSSNDGREVLYSPIYWEENPKQFADLTETLHVNQLLQRLRMFRNQQGCPVELVTDEIIRQAIDLGCLPTPTVASRAGEKAFAFTPLKGVSKHEKDLLAKARAIIACVRYGEHYGTITRIKRPRQFLERVLERRGTGRSHSEIPQQWDLVRKLGIGFFDREAGTSDRYFFRLHEHPDNLKAFDLAIQMLSFGDAEMPNAEEDEARSLLLPGAFVHPTVTRLRVKREGKYSRDNTLMINDLIRGVYSDIF